VPFALLHYTQGWSGIIISFAAGAVLTATYWWKRNLPANMIAHFLIDFLANIGR
jgi:membrane protease YdiL (CAAX protease family)